MMVDRLICRVCRHEIFPHQQIAEIRWPPPSRLQYWTCTLVSVRTAAVDRSRLFASTQQPASISQPETASA